MSRAAETAVPRPGASPASDPLAERRRAVLLLRWVVIIATAYLVLFSRGAERQPLLAALLVAFILSNLVLHFVRGGWILSTPVLSALVVLDSVVCSAALLLTPGVQHDVVIVYFFVVLLSALGGSFVVSVVAAAVTSGLYLAVTTATRGEAQLLEPGVLLQVPFIFCAGIFYGYLSDEARRERRRAETAELSEKAKSELIATLSHDVRNSLGAISGFAEMVREGLPAESEPELRGIAQRIQTIALESVRLIGNLLDASRMEAGKFSIVRRPVPLEEVVARVVERYEAQASLKRIEMGLELPAALPAVVGDEVQLDRAMANLISNAVKFTPEGGRILVAVRADGRALELEIDDSGPGIAPEERPPLFQMYRQTPSGQKLGGTGLGLYVARSVVEAHGGTVEIGTGKLGGALFRVKLPVG